MCGAFSAAHRAVPAYPLFSFSASPALNPHDVLTAEDIFLKTLHLLGF